MAQTALEEYVPAIRALAGRWAAEVATDREAAPDGDFVCSPAGMWLALTAVAAGARGATARELRTVLGVAGPEAAALVTAAGRALGPADGVAVATAAWARTPVHRAFRESLPDVAFGHLPSVAEAVDGRAEAPVDPALLDAWVRRATGGRVAGLPGRPGPRTLLVLVNSLALKAEWATPFVRSRTRDLPFTDASGVARPVPTMTTKLPRPTHAWTAPGADGAPVEVVALRCAAVQVSFVLGAPGSGAADVLPAAWADQRDRRPVAEDAVTIALPRLSLRTRLDATAHLERLGAPSAVAEDADFSAMSPEELTISRLVQDARLTVDEEGVEALAVTDIDVRHVLSAPTRVPRTRHIAFDRPFGTVIFHTPTGTPLFTAWQATAPRLE
ncbi:serpin family protein [Actinacidiphila alni]|uniref:serpin family protein n=1 Tax=Actinacidiphila alni TaxID=380248 RepID=UPI0034537D75